MKYKDDHGNSKKSMREQHVYEIYDTDEKRIEKYGVSGGILNNDGTSKRANNQINYLNRIFGAIRYIATILFTKINGRLEALEKEKELVNKYARDNRGKNPPMQKRPKADND